MKIKKVFIKSFGNLQNLSFDFTNDINVIYGANEAGKSTLAAFIKFMFYSLTAKIKTDNLLERERYMTFGMNSIGGSILFEYCGRDILLSREYITNARQSISAVDNVTFEHIPDLEVAEPGNVIFGVDRNTFSSTVFIRQADLKIKDNGSLSDKLQNMAGSGDENISYKTAVEKIKNAAAGLEYKTKPGKIAALQNEIFNQEILLKKAQENDKIYISIQKKFDDNLLKIKKLDARASELSEKIKDISKNEQLKSLKKAFQIEERINALQENIDGLKKNLLYKGKIYSASEIEQAKFKVREEKLTKEKISKLELEVNEIYKNINEIKAKPREKIYKPFPVYIVFLVLAVLSAAAFFLIGKYALYLSAVFIAAAVVFGVLFFIDHIKGQKKSKASDERLKNEIAEKEKQYGACIAMKELIHQDYVKFIEENKDMLDFVKNADVNEYQKLLDTYSDLSIELEVLKKQYCSLTSTADISHYSREEVIAAEFTSTEDIQTEYESIKNEMSEYETENAALKIKIDDFYNINQSAAEIDTRLRCMRERFDYLSEYKTVYDIALKVIDESKKELESIISPQINKNASEYIKIISGGKYSRLSFDNKFNTEISENRDFLPADYISLGGRDGAYIAMRLAMIDVLYENVPIFFDDSFCNIDSERLCNMKELMLVEADRGNQIFIFTCHERERDLFKEYNVVQI